MSELFLLAARWNGVLLLDEADVYMEDRAIHDLHKNQVISCKSLVGFLLSSATNRCILSTSSHPRILRRYPVSYHESQAYD